MTKEQRLFPYKQKPRIIFLNNYIIMYNLNALFFTISPFTYYNSLFTYVSKLYIEQYMYKTFNNFYYG